MQAALLTINIVVWAAVLAYSLRLVPALARRWHPAAAAGCLAAALALSLFSYHFAGRAQVQARAREHYITGIDERERGNLEAAARHFEEALSLQPGHPEAKRQLDEIQAQKPAEKREQRKETRVSQVPAAGQPPSPPPLSQGTPGKKPEPVPHKQSPFEILHYALDVEIDPEAHSLDGTAVLRVRSRGGDVRALELSLNPEFKPSAVEMQGVPAQFRHTNDLLTVTPKEPLRPGVEATLTVRYRRTGEALVQGGDLISPRGTYLRSEARWYPATGELDFRALVRVKARVPKGYSVVSVGALKGMEKSEKTTLFHWETERAASMVSLAAAKYEQQAVTLRPPAGKDLGLKITCYTFPQHRDRAAAFLKEAAAITRYFEKLFGRYPYEKLAVVEIPLFPGGYGTTSFVMLIDRSFEEKAVPREFLAHEIAHQWWGNSVFPQGLGAAWLTEAFANYSAWMYASAAAGNPRVLQKRVAEATRTYFSAVAERGDQAIYETDPYQQVGATDAILYEKGAVVLHMLRRQVGDAAFKRTLRGFADRYRFGKAKIEDFRGVAEKESGQELGWFFDQWLGREGGPALAYSFDTEPDSAVQNQAVLMVTQTKPPYRAKLKVLLDVENSLRTEEIEISGEHQTFRFPVKGKLTNVLIDPDNAYLMQPPRWVVPGSGQ